MDRRSFLRYMLMSAAALGIDPEKRLRTPGRKKIFIPKPPQRRFFLVFGRNDGEQPFRLPLTRSNAERMLSVTSQRLRELGMSHMYVLSEYKLPSSAEEGWPRH